MRIRVVKANQLTEDEKTKQPASETQLTSAVQAWVKEFKSSKETNQRMGIWQSQKS